MVLGLGACGSNETRTPADDDAAQVDVLHLYPHGRQFGGCQKKIHA
jgi:hypothetical protein